VTDGGIFRGSAFEERRLESRGRSLRYLVGGHGPPLVLVHGWGGAAWNYGELAPLLARRRRLLIPDLPGHGGSAALPAAATLAAYADAVAAVCAAEDAAPVDLFGHSLGGAVGLRLAVRRPELVRRLILAAAAGTSSSTRAAELTLTFFGIVQPGRLVARRARAVARSRVLRRAVFSRFSVSDASALTERGIDGFLRGTALHTDILSAAAALVREDPRRDLHRVACPVLCLWGARDRQVPAEDAIEYARRLRAPLRVIADCGHLLIGERPDACADAVDAFLS
jgi:pimeloyl-ACP methyl ester carboxylesterase